MTGTAQLTVLSKDSLVRELEHVKCVASVIVCGKRAANIARRLISAEGFHLKLHVDEDRNPDAWELF